MPDNIAFASYQADLLGNQWLGKGTNMAITYTYDQAENLVLTEAKEVISIQELSIYIVNVSEDLNIKSGFVEVVDLSEVTDLQISYSSAQNITKGWDKWKHKSHKGSIMYAPTDLAFGILRMMQTLIAMEPGSEETPHLIARNKDDIPELIRKIKA